MTSDEGIRANSSVEKLATLKQYLKSKVRSQVAMLLV